MLDGGGDICPGIFCLGDKCHLSTNTVCFNVSTDTTTNLKEIFRPKNVDQKWGEKSECQRKISNRDKTWLVTSDLSPDCIFSEMRQMFLITGFKTSVIFLILLSTVGSFDFLFFLMFFCNSILVCEGLNSDIVSCFDLSVVCCRLVCMYLLKM